MAIGGVTNGLIGAWGPIVTPFLLHRRLPPWFVLASVAPRLRTVAVSGEVVA